MADVLTRKKKISLPLEGIKENRSRKKVLEGHILRLSREGETTQGEEQLTGR